MSTYVYLECRDHNPPLTSDGEVGQHLCDLPRIRAEIAGRAHFVAQAEHYPDYGCHFVNNAARFLTQHPHCRIGIRDEYNREHPLTGEVTDEEFWGAYGAEKSRWEELAQRLGGVR